MKISTVIGAWIITLLCFASGILWPLGVIGICISLYITIKNLVHGAIDYSRKADSKQEVQQKIEQKEKELLRKQNEILVHLIQDEHRKEGR